MKIDSLTASYNVDLAKKLGINSASLYNKLEYLSKYSAREDGYCWRTAKELENELGLTRKQQEVAIKRLVDAGIIETKNTYIKGTQIKCKHFRIIDKPEINEIYTSDLYEKDKSEMNEKGKSYNNNNTVIEKHNIEKYKNEFEELWKLYPKKEGRTNALKKYISLRNKENITYEQVEKGIKAYCMYIKKNKIERQFIKQGSTWFNQECWNDDYDVEEELKEENKKEILYCDGVYYSNSDRLVVGKVGKMDVSNYEVRTQ